MERKQADETNGVLGCNDLSINLRQNFENTFSYKPTDLLPPQAWALLLYKVAKKEEVMMFKSQILVTLMLSLSALAGNHSSNVAPQQESNFTKATESQKITREIELATGQLRKANASVEKATDHPEEFSSEETLRFKAEQKATITKLQDLYDRSAQSSAAGRVKINCSISYRRYRIVPLKPVVLRETGETQSSNRAMFLKALNPQEDDAFSYKVRYAPFLTPKEENPYRQVRKEWEKLAQDTCAKLYSKYEAECKEGSRWNFCSYEWTKGAIEGPSPVSDSRTPKHSNCSCSAGLSAE